MRVLAINGSPNEKGCCYTALGIIAEELKKEAIDTQIFHIGTKPIGGCVACRLCAKKDPVECVYDDVVNKAIALSKEADGFIFASPVHFSGIAGNMKSFMDRFFFAGGPQRLAYKAGMSIVSVRRSGGSATFDQLNHYLHYSKMIIPSSQYWNIIHGHTNPADVHEDKEGVQIMQVAARNLAWAMKLIAEGKIAPPVAEAPLRTNFVR